MAADIGISMAWIWIATKSANMAVEMEETIIDEENGLSDSDNLQTQVRNARALAFVHGAKAATDPTSTAPTETALAVGLLMAGLGDDLADSQESKEAKALAEILGQGSTTVGVGGGSGTGGTGLGTGASAPLPPFVVGHQASLDYIAQAISQADAMGDQILGLVTYVNGQPQLLAAGINATNPKVGVLGHPSLQSRAKIDPCDIAYGFTIGAQNGSAIMLMGSGHFWGMGRFTPAQKAEVAGLTGLDPNLPP